MALHKLELQKNIENTACSFPTHGKVVGQKLKKAGPARESNAEPHRDSIVTKHWNWIRTVNYTIKPAGLQMKIFFIFSLKKSI